MKTAAESKMLKGKHTCRTCKGWKVTQCGCCGEERDCEDCEGTGLNAVLVDIERWKKAEHEFHKSATGATWDWMVERVCVGRTSDNKTGIKFSDFEYERNPNDT